MKTRLLLFTACLSLASPPPAGAAGPEDSTVKVIALVRYPNPLKPWAKEAPVESGRTEAAGKAVGGGVQQPCPGPRQAAMRRQ